MPPLWQLEQGCRLSHLTLRRRHVVHDLGFRWGAGGVPLEEGEDALRGSAEWEFWSSGEGKELLREGDRGLWDCIGDVLKASAREEVGGLTVGRLFWLRGLAIDSEAMVAATEGSDLQSKPDTGESFMRKAMWVSS